MTIKRYHFVYRITNIRAHKHYYGTHTTSKNRALLPKEELGVYYFSSSTDKDFINDQKSNPTDFKYKVIRVFKTRKEALNFEIYLHNKFDVGINESFYNRSKQTNTKFDTTGKSAWNKGIRKNIDNRVIKGVKQMLETRYKNDSYRSGKIKEVETRNKIDKNGLTIYQKGVIKCKKTISSKIWKETIGKEKKRKEIETKLKKDKHGLNSNERGALKLKEHYLATSKRYNILKDDKIVQTNLTPKEIKEMSQALMRTSKENPLGKSGISLSKLKYFKKEYLIGYYIQLRNVE